MAIILLHDELNAQSRAFLAQYGPSFDSVLTTDRQGSHPWPQVQGYPSVLFDIPAHVVPASGNIPAHSVPAGKGLIYNPPDFATVQAEVARRSAGG